MVCIHIGMVAINPSEDIWIDLPMIYQALPGMTRGHLHRQAMLKELNCPVLLIHGRQGHPGDPGYPRGPRHGWSWIRMVCHGPGWVYPAW